MTGMEENKNVYKFCLGNLVKKDHSENLGIDGRTILRNNIWVCGPGLCDLEYVSMAVFFKHGYERSYFIKGGQFIDQLSVLYVFWTALCLTFEKDGSRHLPGDVCPKGTLATVPIHKYTRRYNVERSLLFVCLPFISLRCTVCEKRAIV
jgi:hypothetical protein